MKPNYDEMICVANASDWMYEIEDAGMLLGCCWARFFGSAEVKGLSADDAREVGTLLRMCVDHIRDAVLDYRLAVGEDGPGVDMFFDLATYYREARELARRNMVM